MFITTKSDSNDCNTFIEDKLYQTEEGLGLIAYQEAENSMMFFKNIVMLDKTEMSMTKEGRPIYEIDAFVESALDSVWDNIKDCV